MSEYLKMLVRAPTDKCSFMRMLMDPISQLDAYRKYARCKIELLGFVVGVFGALICLYSFFQAPFYADVKRYILTVAESLSSDCLCAGLPL